MEQDSVDIQYIFCECGDNFSSEKLLNIHLANGHEDVEVFQCESCSEIFTSENLFQKHQNEHKMQKLLANKAKIEELKICNRKQDAIKKEEPTQKELAVKDKPQREQLLKNNMRWIDSESLMENLRVYSRVKAEPPESPQVPASGLEAGETVECAAEEVAEEVVVGDAEQEDEDIYYQCSVCRKIFASEEYFDSHYKRVHADIIDEIALAQDAEQTVKEHEDYNDCRQEAVQPSEAEALEPAAAAREQPPPAGPEQVVYYKCDLCKTLYPSERAYDSHFSKKHGAKGFRFIEQDLERSLAPPPGACFRCELCPRTFPLRRSLGLHRRRVHAARLGLPPAAPSRASPRVACPLCARECSACNMVYHMRTHTGEKPYLCSECPKRFSAPRKLQIHFRIHTGETPYQCPLCPKAFRTKTDSNRHERVHTGVKPYACPHCGKSFSRSNSMKTHVKTVHLKIPAPYRPRRNKSERFGVQLLYQ